MSLEYQKLKPKRFAKKSFKHSQEARYWKKFQNVLMEKDPDMLQRSDIDFCAGDKPYLMATAISARVDIYKLTQPENEEDAKDQIIKPAQTIFKFKDTTTALQLRQDGNLILCGEKTGRIQLIELQNKFILKTYHESLNQVNSFDFKSTMREFVTCSHDTLIRGFSILETQSVFNINNAHGDNVKKVSYLKSDENMLVSGSADRTVKLWDLRQYGEPVGVVKLGYSVEDFVEMSEGRMVVANGSVMSMIDMQDFSVVKEYHAFQKPIMKIRYDKVRDRLMAGGLDNQLKFFTFEQDELKVAYKIKVPSEIFSMDVSADGNHFAMGLNDGSLIIKSKLIEKIDEQNAEEKLIFKSLEPRFQQTSKNYKYFFRGQYVTPDMNDLIAEQKQKKVKLQQYEQHLKKFQYKQALSSALRQKNPEVVSALLEELVERGALEIALGNRNEEEVILVLDFIHWKITDYRYQGLLIEVLRVVMDMYSGVLGGLNKKVDDLLFKDIAKGINNEIEINSSLKQIQGQIEMMLRMVQVTQGQ